MSEQSLKNKLKKDLAHDFYILEEISGYHPIYDQKVRIDFMFKAKSHLVNSGFTDGWFGIECKWIKGLGGQTSKTTKMVWQSITDAQSIFEIEGKKITPKFIAVFTPDNLEKQIAEHLKTLLSLALYGNVGQLYFYSDGTGVLSLLLFIVGAIQILVTM